MIPRHGLPLGIGSVGAALVSPLHGPHLSELEKAYAERLGAEAVMLIPSVRAGIRMVIHAVTRPDLVVVGPAYTCRTVHEAMALGGAPVRLIDTAPDSFLMPLNGIAAAIGPDSALLLSEVYGIPYCREMLPKAACVRIFDLAMGVPTPERIGQLERRDVALFSFGRGKPMYAGWGGIACFRDLELAGKVRELLDRMTVSGSFVVRLRHDCSTFFHVMLNQRRIYGVLHQRHLYRWYKNVASKSGQEGAITGNNSLEQASRATPCALPSEWSCPMTILNGRLALHNLRDMAEHAETRRRQAETYFRNLVEPGHVSGPDAGSLPQSHFPIRIPSRARDALCDYLRGRGIDTGTLFPFPAGLDREAYPHAAKAAEEVVTLPMGPSITLAEVETVARTVKNGLQMVREKLSLY